MHITIILETFIILWWYNIELSYIVTINHCTQTTLWSKIRIIIKDSQICASINNISAILESFIPLESEFVFLEHDPNKLIKLWKINRKNSKYHLLWHSVIVNISHVITRPVCEFSSLNAQLCVYLHNQKQILHHRQLNS